MEATSGTNRSNGSEPSSISATLLDRIRAHRPDAWQKLVDLYGPVVYRWCRQLGVGRTDAADVVQDVFTAVSTGVGRFHRSKPGDSFGGWLRTITRSKVMDFFRRRQGRPHAEGGTTAYLQMLDIAEVSATEASIVGTPIASPPALGSGRNASPLSTSFQDGGPASRRLETDSRFAQRAMEVVRAEFEPQTWNAFWQIVVDRQTPAEVSAALKMSLPAVYKAKSRVLQRLRRELKDSEE
jgi:RNA polymerase sigma-70 factor (ECF subfamily)